MVSTISAFIHAERGPAIARWMSGEKPTSLVKRSWFGSALNFKRSSTEAVSPQPTQATFCQANRGCRSYSWAPPVRGKWGNQPSSCIPNRSWEVFYSNSENLGWVALGPPTYPRTQPRGTQKSWSTQIPPTKFPPPILYQIESTV